VIDPPPEKPKEVGMLSEPPLTGQSRVWAAEQPEFAAHATVTFSLLSLHAYW